MSKSNLIKELKPPDNVVQAPPIPIPESLKKWYKSMQDVLKKLKATGGDSL